MGKGYIALIAILIISAALVLVALSSSHFGIAQLSMKLQRNQAQKSYWLAQACAEEALMRLAEDHKYQGDETININGESCDILPIESPDKDRQIIKVISSAFDQVRKIKIEIEKKKIKSWQEVAEF